MSRVSPNSYEVPLFHMRGGTSTWVIVNASDLPKDETKRDAVLRQIMGVPKADNNDHSQITGLGRGTPTSNKLFIIEVIDKEKYHVKSTLAQFAASKANIDWSVNCGNMSSAIPLYLTESQLLNFEDGPHCIHIQNTNTNKTTQAYIETKNGKISQFTEIPGVTGAYPAVTLELDKPVGTKTGLLFPTGNSIDIIDGIEVSCLDVNVPMVIVNAMDLGKTANEFLSELNNDTQLLVRLKRIWVQAGLKMKLRHPDGALFSRTELENSETIPKICIIAPSRHGGDINTRYFTPQKAHQSLAVSGGGCLAAACLVEGTLANRLIKGKLSETSISQRRLVRIENPAGVLEIDVLSEGGEITKIFYKRNAQVLVKGHGLIYDS